MNANKLSFVTLIEHLKASDHLGDMLDGIHAKDILSLLSKAGRKDALAMLKKPARISRYIQVNRHKVVAMLNREKPAQDTIVAWLNCQLREITHADRADADDAEITITFPLSSSLLEQLIKKWATEEIWWKAVLAIGAVDLTDPDLIALDAAHVDQLLDRFDEGSPRLLDIIVGRLHARSTEKHIRAALKDLQDESKRIAVFLGELAGRLEAQKVLPTSEELDELTTGLHGLQEVFAHLQEYLIEPATKVSLPDEIVPPDECKTLAELSATCEQILKALTELETQKQQSSMRDKVIPLLQPVLNLARVDGQEMDELAAVKEKAQALIDSVEIFPFDEATAQEFERLRSGSHPLCLLTQVVSGDLVEDEELLAVDEAISTAFGRKLAIIALSGRLALVLSEGKAETPVLPETTPEPDILEEVSIEPPADAEEKVPISGEIEPRVPGKAEIVVTPVEPEKVLQGKPGDIPPEASETKVEIGPVEEEEAVEVSPEPEIVSEIGEQSHVEDSLPVSALATLGKEWDDLFWGFVYNDDISGAYWLVRSWEMQDVPVPVPSWLLAALQGARWLTHSRGKLVEDLDGIAHQYELPSNSVHRLFGVAAALVPSLVAPITGLISWLGEPGIPGLTRLVEAVKGYASFGYALRQEDLMGVSGQARLSSTLTEIVDRAKQWTKEAPARRLSFKRATDVWRYWVGPRGELRRMLSLVADDKQDAMREVRVSIEQWRRDSIVERMHTDDVSSHGRRSKRIVGAARNKLINDAEEALQLAEEWCDLVERQREVESRGDWFSKQVQQLVDGVRVTWPEAKAALDELASDVSTKPMATAAHVTLQALDLLCDLLHLPGSGSDTGSVVGVSPYIQPLDAKGGLWNALAYRLLFLPEATLDEKGQLTSDTLPRLAELLMKAHREERSLRDAFEGWLARQDYRFGVTLLAALSEEPDAADLNRRWQESMSGSQVNLKEAIRRTTDAIEQAIIDNIIEEIQKAEYDATVEAVLEGESTRNYGPLHDRLKDIRHKLQQARSNRLRQQQKHWKSIQERLATEVSDAALRDQIVTFMHSALERKDTVVVDERLASLEESLDRGKKPDVAQFSPPEDQRDAYQEFLDRLPRLNGLLKQYNLSRIIKAIESKERLTGLESPHLPRPRIEETIKAMQAWRQLKKQKGRFRVNSGLLADILSYLGFSFTGYSSSGVTEQQRGKDWAYVQVNMSASDLSPVPQFGSQQDGHFNVVCLWERPGLDTISALLHDMNLQHENTLVLYFGRLLERQRLDVVRFAREKPLGMVILDEILLVFLAREYESRLPVFLRCALPIAFVNPYVATGIVLPEMFFGRDDMIQSLQSSTGVAIVYGGRQLGKSALLRRVAREFHRPEQEQYALYEDIKLLGDPSGQTHDALWRRLRDGLTRLGLLETRAELPETILRKIREVMDASPQRRVLVLLDEADKFLKADADQKPEFEIVSNLKRLMDDTNRRFKVVFAGLHNVQRFQNIPNQPLAHLGSLPIGPLEPGAARQLIRQPIESLGFRFADERAILRILAYTNYHPGLIQLFCHELLARLREQRVTNLVPYQIRQSDIEAVYRNDEVRNEIRKRFDWTLALDLRYQVITWSLVIDQMEDRDGYARAYSLADILELGQSWWPQGFKDVALDQLQGILGEMCGLGVLVRNTSDHRYRLRSPNLVRLMGTEEDIELSLLELGEKEPELETIIPDSHHAPLDDQARRYSPFTYAQTSILNVPRFGVGLIFGSDALGLNDVRDASRQFIPADADTLTTDKWDEMRFAGNSGRAMDQWLRKFLDRQNDSQRLIAYRYLRGSSQQLTEQVQAALKFCSKHEKRQRQWMRVLLVFDPIAAWDWLHLEAEQRNVLEERADAVVWLCRWDTSGLRQRLDQHGKMSSAEDCRHLLEQSGGWPWLLDKLSDRWSDGKDDPLEGVESLWQELQDDENQLRSQFISALGIANEPPIQHVLDFIVEQGPVPDGLLTPDMIGGEPTLPDAECKAAIACLQGLKLVQVRNNEFTVETVVERILSA